MKRLVFALVLCLVLVERTSAGSLRKKRTLEEDFPDVGLTPPQMIERQGYPAETHWVTTSDGYILQMHRIPNPGRPVILVQHGSLSSSADWLLMGEGKCIPYMLYDRGYDVWLGNARGNTWSRNHTWMDPNTNLDFWDFTFHEMGIYDLPAVIDYMLAQTGVQKIDYIGHSMGTTMFYVLCSELPEYNARIRQMHSYAPVAFMELTRSPLLLYIVPWVWTWDWISQMMGQGEYMPSEELSTAVASETCSDESYLQEACAMQIFMLCGYSPNQLNYTTLPLIQVYSPAGTSTKTILHFTKEILSWQFEQYDYGGANNLPYYGQMFPPNYQLEKITAPVYFHYADNDLLAHPWDVDKLAGKVANNRGMYKVPLLLFSHIDFIWGIDAETLVYDLTFQQLGV